MNSALFTALLFGATALIGLFGAWIADARAGRRPYPLTKSLGDFAAVSLIAFIMPIAWAWWGNGNLFTILLLRGSNAQNSMMIILYANSFKFVFLHLVNWHRHRGNPVTPIE